MVIADLLEPIIRAAETALFVFVSSMLEKIPVENGVHDIWSKHIALYWQEFVFPPYQDIVARMNFEIRNMAELSGTSSLERDAHQTFFFPTEEERQAILQVFDLLRGKLLVNFSAGFQLPTVLEMGTLLLFLRGCGGFRLR